MRATACAILLGALTAACGTPTDDVVRNDPEDPGTTWLTEFENDESAGTGG